MKQRKRTLVTAAIALALVCGISAGKAMAYFTTFATAKGGHEITLGTETKITEEFSRWTKRITLANTGRTECYARVRVFAGAAYKLEITGSDNWYEGDDGYWYYEKILPPGGKTEEQGKPDELNIKINLPQITDELGNSIPYTEDFNVVVIQECTAVLYAEDGSAYADWDNVLESGSDRYEWEEGGAENEG